MPDFSAWGIDEGFRDDFGRWRTVSEETKLTFLAAMDATQSTPPESTVVFLRQGFEKEIPESSTVRLEDGTELRPRKNCRGYPAGLSLDF